MERITNELFGFDGVFVKERFMFKINTSESVVVKSSHKGSPTGDLSPFQQGTDKNTELQVAVYHVSDNSAHTYEITDSETTLTFEIKRKKIIWL